MGKNTASGALETRRKIVDAYYDITLTSGISEVTFSTIANHAGISRSGVGAHFKQKRDMTPDVLPRLTGLIIQQLNFSDVDSLIESWESASSSSNTFNNALVGALTLNPERVHNTFEQLTEPLGYKASSFCFSSIIKSLSRN